MHRSICQQERFKVFHKVRILGGVAWLEPRRGCYTLLIGFCRDLRFPGLFPFPLGYWESYGFVRDRQLWRMKFRATVKCVHWEQFIGKFWSLIEVLCWSVSLCYTTCFNSVAGKERVKHMLLLLCYSFQYRPWPCYWQVSFEVFVLQVVKNTSKHEQTSHVTSVFQITRNLLKMIAALEAFGLEHCVVNNTSGEHSLSW